MMQLAEKDHLGGFEKLVLLSFYYKKKTCLRGNGKQDVLLSY